MEKIMNDMIGAIFEVKRPAGMLGNPVGTRGYVFNEYTDMDDISKLGVQIIFPNGNYDGFSYAEQKEFLKQVGFNLDYSIYEFKNVMQVSRDFDAGYWKW
jgi:hypothetical protein